MNSRRLLWLLPAIGIFLAPAAHAWFEDSDVGPRAIGLGKAFAGIADDASALNWNAAGLATLPKREVDLSVARPYGVTELRSAYGVMAWPMRWGTLAASWQHIGATDVASENTFSVGAGHTIFQSVNGVSLDVGAALKLFRLSVGDFFGSGTLQSTGFGSATGTAADVGVMLRLPRKIQIGWALQNLGSPTFDLVAGGGSTSLPTRSRFGIGYRWNPESIVGFDLQQVPGRGTIVNLGGEIWFYNSVAVRVGATDRDAGGGVSVKAHAWQLDLAFLTNQPLGISYRAGLKVPF